MRGLRAERWMLRVVMEGEGAQDTCGVRKRSSWGQGDDAKVTVTLRCLDGVDVTSLPVQHWDGASY